MMIFDKMIVAVATKVLEMTAGEISLPGGSFEVSLWNGFVIPIRNIVGRIRKKSSQMKCQFE